jgi:N4-gp56 family major capsid protein
MADWEFTTANALAAQEWAKKWWIGVKKENFFYETGLIGGDENNDVIVEFPELEQNQGYQITYGQIRDLSGAGITGDSDLENQEEAPVTYDDNITLNQKRNAIRTKGKLSDQYPSDKRAREWALKLLERWKGAVLDQDIFTAIGSSCTKFLYGGSATATTNIAAGGYMTLKLIAQATAYGDKASPQIVGKSKGGEKQTVCVMAIDQRYDLKQFDASWAQAQREAMQKGKDNLIFHKVLGIYEDCALFAHIRCPIVTNWGSGSTLPGATAFFIGVGAGAIAYAKKKVWNEKTFDYGNKVGFAIGSIYGVSKSVFNQVDNAVLAIATYRTNN